MKKFGSASRRADKGSNGVSFINMGTSLLLVVFLVLCLVVFAVLSISTAQADYNLTANQAGQTTEYYTACTKAEEILSDIDRRLAEGGIMALDSSISTAEIATADTTATPDMPYTLEEDGEHVSFSVQVNDSQVLDVVIRLTEASLNYDNRNAATETSGTNTPANSLHYYEIETWQLLPISDWQPQSNSTLVNIE